jgi:16S rRNA processing protein RimM
LKGEVRIELLLDDDRVFQPGHHVIIATAAGQCETEIEFFRRQHGRFVLKLRGIDTISAAEQWRDAEIKIPTSDLSATEEGWFYTFQLKGCEVFDTGGEYLGIVTEILDLGGSEVLKVDREQTEILIPFAHVFLKKIDLEQKKIEVDLPEGLRELNN